MLKTFIKIVRIVRMSNISFKVLNYLKKVILGFFERPKSKVKPILPNLTLLTLA